MVEVDQHQQPLMHAIDRAKQAITTAKETRWSLEQAHIVSDPHLLQSAHARLIEAEKEVNNAIEQLEYHATESHYQQIAQTLTQLRAASLDLEAAADSYTTPKQVR